ncbi:hypothetical protein A2774_03075 [Candidatus Roizmanbacteria bacterium RIFCSPHIGHO2_01_FULL_39_12c]|uniref:Glycosyl transferase family 1 domain-containing protein n=1 Tax=Candidatus Roizmanbacteria bacterium RIFCSPHIGHO2_01_FULL_39_12c TaxID=1802031 RepID=A0A1F7GBS6_9BACT|nr:MAG: hypothetical protein A2774_03075 [Candidatus Roizmanbacteria bacterium RIFCSPHIGHO2_01_FULL_39_12c]OGK47418.1 MAG: hypothetical protein A2963_04665 [Candidatus Roizmanbacteria bacterium RIFCSPLOWO2_01_FULL_40_13]
MKKIDLLILTWHQTYLSKNAGGYIRLREFFKYIPNSIRFIIMDNQPSIYSDAVAKHQLYHYQTPAFLKFLEKRFFLFWFTLENIFAGIILYLSARRLIRDYQPKVLYVPIGEFVHIYFPSILLKLQFPKIKLVVDILNFEIPGEGAINYYRTLRKSGINFIRSLFTIYATIQSSFLIKKSIRLIDYVFTVSPDLVDKLRVFYKKDTIDYTLSGVTIPKKIKAVKKSFLGVYVGRLTVQKGVFELLDIWSMLVKKLPIAKLALAGQVDEVTKLALLDRISKLKLKKNVTFFGAVSESKKQKILSRSQIFLHLARYEPLFPVIGILEGLAQKLPVIIYNMKVVDSQLKEGLTDKPFLIAENGNKERVVQKILEFFQFPARQKTILAKEAYQLANKFDWSIIAEKEFNIINRMIKLN